MDPSWDTLQGTNISHLKKKTAVSCLVGSMTESKKNCVWNRSFLNGLIVNGLISMFNTCKKKGPKETPRAWNPAIAYQSFAEKTRIHESSWSEIHLRIRSFNPWTGFSSNWTSIISPNNVSVAFTKKNPKELKKTHTPLPVTSRPSKKKKVPRTKKSWISMTRAEQPWTSCQVTGLTCSVNF